MLKIMRLEERIVLDGAAAVVAAEQAAEHVAEPADVQSETDSSQKDAAPHGENGQQQDSSGESSQEGEARSAQEQGEAQKDTSSDAPPSGGAEETVSEDSGSAKETLRESGVENDLEKRAQNPDGEPSDTDEQERSAAEAEKASAETGTEEAASGEKLLSSDSNEDGAREANSDDDGNQPQAAAPAPADSSNGDGDSPENQAAENTRTMVDYAYEDDAAAREIMRQIQASLDSNGRSGDSSASGDGDGNVYSGSGYDDSSIFTQQELQGMWENVGYVVESGGDTAVLANARTDASPENLLGVLQGLSSDNQGDASAENIVLQGNVVDAAAYAALVTPRKDGSGTADEKQMVLDAAALEDAARILVIDVNVQGYQQLIENADPAFEILLIDNASDGLQQIADYLEGRDDVETLAIVTHGGPAEVRLGLTVLNDGSLLEAQPILETIGSHLTDSADIHFYGCDVASTPEGEAFLARIAEITGADVAGSDDATAAGIQGADMDLEYHVGSIEDASPFSMALAGFTQTLDHGESTNLAPVGVDDFFSTTQDDAFDFSVGDLTGNDSDPDGDSFFLYQIDFSTSGGATVTYNGDGTFTYDPSGQFDHLGQGETANDTFSYWITDNKGGQVSALVTVTIEGLNDPPVAVDDALSTDEDTPVGFDVDFLKNNDSDPDGDTIFVVNVDGTGTNGGTITDNGDGTFTYNPNGQFEHLGAGEVAYDTFTYTISDNKGGTSTATVTVTIEGRNDPPVAVNDALSTDEDTSVNFDVPFLKSNDYDPDGDDFYVVHVDGSGTQGGVVTYNGNGNFTYDPNGQFEYLQEGDVAYDTFTYTISDNKGGTSTATVIVTIEGRNDAPQTTGLRGIVSEDGVLEFMMQTPGEQGQSPNSGYTFDAMIERDDVDVNNVPFNSTSVQDDVATDVDSDQVTFLRVIPTGATQGQVSLNSEGKIVYNPLDVYDYLQIGETATDTFNYELIDEHGDTVIGTAIVTIEGRNDAPIGQDHHRVITEDEIIDQLDLLAGATDIDGGDLVVTGVSSSQGDSVSELGVPVIWNPDGSFVYDPREIADYLEEGESLFDSFTYTFTDGYVSVTYRVTIEILGISEAGDGADGDEFNGLPSVPELFSTEGDVPPGGIGYDPFDPLRPGPGVIAGNVPGEGAAGPGTTVTAGPDLQPTGPAGEGGGAPEAGVVAPLLGIETFIEGGEEAAEIISRRIDELFGVDEATRDELQAVNTAVSNALFDDTVTDRGEAIRMAYEQLSALVANMTQQEINDTRSVLQVWVRSLELASTQNGVQLDGVDDLLRQIGVNV